MVWGYLDAAVRPVLTVASGDTVRLTSWGLATARACRPSSLVDPAISGDPRCARGPRPAFRHRPGLSSGAEPGDVLQVDILSVDLADDWGFVAILPLFGTLPEDFDEHHTIHPRIDRARGVCGCRGARSCRSRRSSA